MDWLDFYWDAEIDAHIAQNKLTREDVENAVWHAIGSDQSDSSGRPARFGYALDGRCVIVVYEVVDEITILPITAYEVKL